MSAEVIPFDFEEQAVRVVMRDGDPWFVAADVCRVLEIQNATDAVKRLDDDEVTLDTIEGSHRQTNVINESGLYALVLTSRKEQAKRFRKWITAEVLPAIRRTGRYEHPGLTAQPRAEGEIFGMTLREAELVLSAVREARLTRGPRAAARLWDRTPLPPLADLASPDPAEGRAALAHLRDHLGAQIKASLAARDDSLTAEGLRCRTDGLFVANFALPCFQGTRWGGGAHRGALAGLHGIVHPANPLTLAGVVTRGIVLPWALLDGEVV
ncbi:MAG: Bro-N domain-containing protein [Pseudomonadota bacterium]